MGIFDIFGAQDAHKQVNDGGKPRHQITHELLAGAVGFEAMRLFERHQEQNGRTEHHKVAKELLAGFVAAEIEKHAESGLYDHLDLEKVRRQAEEQAHHLFDHANGR